MLDQLENALGGEGEGHLAVVSSREYAVILSRMIAMLWAEGTCSSVRVNGGWSTLSCAQNVRHVARHDDNAFSCRWRSNHALRGVAVDLL